MKDQNVTYELFHMKQSSHETSHETIHTTKPSNKMKRKAFL